MGPLPIAGNIGHCSPWVFRRKEVYRPFNGDFYGVALKPYEILRFSWNPAEKLPCPEDAEWMIAAIQQKRPALRIYWPPEELQLKLCKKKDIQLKKKDRNLLGRMEDPDSTPEMI